MKYAIIYYDGCNGARFGGITTQEEIEARYGPVVALSRNHDGLLELGQTDVMAVPTEGVEFDWAELE